MRNKTKENQLEEAVLIVIDTKQAVKISQILIVAGLDARAKEVIIALLMMMGIYRSILKINYDGWLRE